MVLKVVTKVALGLVVGVVVGTVGSVAHWGHRPWGLVAGLVLVLASATMMRAWAGRAALAAQVVGLGAALAVLSRPGPAGDVLVQLSTARPPLAGVDPAVFGRIWVVGSAVAAVLVAVAPAVLFSDRPAAPQALGEEPWGEADDDPGEGPAVSPAGETDR